MGEVLKHNRNDVRLRDSLSGADRERVVFISIATKWFRHKSVPWHLLHGIQYSAITNASLRQTGANHPCPLHLERFILK